MQFASFMRNLGVPWAFPYGNHDTDARIKAYKEKILFEEQDIKIAKTSARFGCNNQ